jgi:hypothetical protein
MSRISVPHDSSFSAAEVRRQRKAEEAFERRCAEAAKEIERITDPDVLVARLRDHEALDGAVMIAIERALASMSDATVARAEEYLAQESYDVALSVTSALIKIGRPAVDTLLRIVRSSALSAPCGCSSMRSPMARRTCAPPRRKHSNAFRTTARSIDCERCCAMSKLFGVRLPGHCIAVGCRPSTWRRMSCVRSQPTRSARPARPCACPRARNRCSCGSREAVISWHGIEVSAPSVTVARTIRY